MNSIKKRNLFSLIINIAIIVLTIYSVSRFFISEGDGNMQVSGFSCFKYFTVLSNVLAALTCAAVLPASIKALRDGEEHLSHRTMLWKFVGTVAVTVTLVVVLVFLGPTMGYGIMFIGASLYLHLICPVLALVSFCLLERGGRVARKEFILGDLTVLIYGAVYLINVVWSGVWIDFYGFNRGGMWYISFPIMLVGGLLLSLIVGVLHNAAQPKETAEKA